MLKKHSKIKIINNKIKRWLRGSLVLFCMVLILTSTTALASQEIEINPLGLNISLSNEFVVYKNRDYINSNYEDEFEKALEDENLYFVANSISKSMSIQIWELGECKYPTINELNDSKIRELMKDIGVFEFAQDIMIENSIETSIQTNNGQKYYMLRGIPKEITDYSLEYVFTVNNGYIIWYQIFHYDNYLKKNTNELLDSIEVTQNKNFYSDIVKVENATNDLHRRSSVETVTRFIFYALVLGCIGLVKKLWGKLVNKKDDNEKNLKEDSATDTLLQSGLCTENEKEDLKIENEKKGNLKEYEICIFDIDSKVLKKETKEIDIIKIPPSKYAINNTYYAVEKVKDGKKVRVYYTKDNWDKEVETNL